MSVLQTYPKAAGCQSPLGPCTRGRLAARSRRLTSAVDCVRSAHRYALRDERVEQRALLFRIVLRRPVDASRSQPLEVTLRHAAHATTPPACRAWAARRPRRSAAFRKAKM